MPASKILGPQYGIAGIKYTMDRLGYFGGLPRPPLLPVSVAGQREIDAMLTAIMGESLARS